MSPRFLEKSGDSLVELPEDIYRRLPRDLCGGGWGTFYFMKYLE